MKKPLRLSKTIPSLHTPLLSFIVFINTIIICIALSLPYTSQSLEKNWVSRLNNTTLIALAPNMQDDPIASHDDAEHFVSTLQKNTLDIHNVHLLTSHEIDAILSTWSHPWPRPLPQLVSARYDGNIEDLNRYIHSFAPTALIIPPPPQANLIKPITHALQREASLLSNLLIIQSLIIYIVTLILIIKKSFQEQKNNYITLRNFGIYSFDIHYKSSYHTALYTLFGSTLGSISALFIMIYSIQILRPILHLQPYISSPLTLMIHPPISEKLLQDIILIPILLGLTSFSISYTYGIWKWKQRSIQ